MLAVSSLMRIGGAKVEPIIPVTEKLAAAIKREKPVSDDKKPTEKKFLVAMSVLIKMRRTLRMATGSAKPNCL